jgi:cobalamin biosynthetic protein CobC
LLEHGGQLYKAAQKYQIPLHEWLDLSTGINPLGWMIEHMLPNHVWAQLPQEDDGLVQVASSYYQTDSLLATAGSQAAIQALPMLRDRSTVAIVTPSYAEHAHAWQQSNHKVLLIDANQIDNIIEQADVLVMINPNNPTGTHYEQQQLLRWQQILAAKSGWLIIDEAFIDATPEYSLIEHCPKAGLIILRSLGKFFGLAGLRVGFVYAEQAILNRLATHLGPWPIAHASRYIAKQALADTKWQRQTQQQLHQQSIRLQQLLSAFDLEPSGSCALFQWVKTSNAASIHRQLAKQGILTRYFDKPSSLRFGLAKTEQDWNRLQTALSQLELKK